MFRWVDTWVPCYVFHPSFLTMWGAKCVPASSCIMLSFCKDDTPFKLSWCS